MSCRSEISNKLPSVAYEVTYLNQIFKKTLKKLTDTKNQFANLANLMNKETL